MKKLLYVFLVLSQLVVAQSHFDKEAAQSFQENLNKNYAVKEKSPLKPEDLKTFTALDFFAINANYCVEAKFIRTKKEQPFEMPTTTSRKPLYVKYGELHFVLDGVSCRLNVYQNVEFSKMPQYKDDLFLPYTDLTSGVESYGGGRYIDIKIQEGKKWIIDFNRSYNPYCAYNEVYSCPIPPKENDLKVEIKAGVKAFKKY